MSACSGMRHGIGEGGGAESGGGAEGQGCGMAEVREAGRRVEAERRAKVKVEAGGVEARQSVGGGAAGASQSALEGEGGGLLGWRGEGKANVSVQPWVKPVDQVDVEVAAVPCTRITSL
eukprot:CAMPEP_0174699418 /NCGR_PEP_ID=MMETSP1094-20130205/4706_1 /TAXON_ID=156173 /ORGANISM="Chrysochromulina brevifilum, Strain UTEX LB 985" /LENGTH=118 /DNA_ID=CAMNT_0015896745 /DNA_START=198 /DNA_END=551 /DNA_ORIENTATION=-